MSKTHRMHRGKRNAPSKEKEPVWAPFPLASCAWESNPLSRRGAMNTIAYLSTTASTAISGQVLSSHVDEQGVRHITDFQLLSVSLVDASQVLHPSLRIVEVKYE